MLTYRATPEMAAGKSAARSSDIMPKQQNMFHDFTGCSQESGVLWVTGRQAQNLKRKGQAIVIAKWHPLPRSPRAWQRPRLAQPHGRRHRSLAGVGPAEVGKMGGGHELSNTSWHILAEICGNEARACKVSLNLRPPA